MWLLIRPTFARRCLPIAGHQRTVRPVSTTTRNLHTFIGMSCSCSTAVPYLAVTRSFAWQPQALTLSKSDIPTPAHPAIRSGGR